VADLLSKNLRRRPHEELTQQLLHLTRADSLFFCLSVVEVLDLLVYGRVSLCTPFEGSPIGFRLGKSPPVH
jgi:hypothetical protein